MPFYLRYSDFYFTHYKTRCTPQDEIALCHMQTDRSTARIIKR
ncbi:hypothetical protein CSC13_4776 [Klebsiella pneumoniae]|nr:hypothetical protein CSC13_4776 [Klebsiella pneumoniae]